MSRRARLEDEKLKLLNEELKGEEDKIKLQKERIYAPIIWKRLNSGIKIQDMKPSYYDEVLALVKELYMREEVLCRNSELVKDEESVASYLDKVLFNLKDQTSLIALDEKKEDEIAAFFVLKVVHKSDFGRVLSRVQLVNGDAHKKCVTLANYLTSKADLFAMFDCDVFLRFYLLCIKPGYRHKGLGFQLMLTAVEVAKSLNIPAIMGLFSCGTMQKNAKRLGMQVLIEQSYVDYRDRYNEMIFDDPGVGNYTCAVMGGPLPPPPPPEPKRKAQAVEEVEAPRATRGEKRKEKVKQAAKAAAKNK